MSEQESNPITDVAVVRNGEPRESTTGDMERLLYMAVEKDLALDKLEKLLELHERHEAMEARKAFVAAKAAFAAEAPMIRKDKDVGYKTKDGDLVGYSHATIGNVIETAGPVLGRHGFSWSWSPTTGDKAWIRVTCRLTHAMGHFEEATLEAGPDTSGKKNPIQQVASAVSYLQRYTFLMVTGLSTRDQRDDDGTSTPTGRPSGDGLSKRARDAIERFRQYLGDDARAKMEEATGIKATDWDDNVFSVALAALWGDLRKARKA